jgi:hypothetical protein
VYGYRDAKGRSRTKTYKSFGYLDELEHHHDDPIAYFTEVVAELNKRSEVKDEIRSNIKDRKKPKQMRKVVTKNLGYVFPYAYYQKLKIEPLWKNIQQKEGLLYDLNSAFRLLVLLRCLEPTRKSTNMYQSDLLFEHTDFNEEQFLQAVGIFSRYSERFNDCIRRHLREFYNPDNSIGYNNVVSAYFGIQARDTIESRRIEQKKRKEMIFQLGCICDRNGIPLDAKYMNKYDNDPKTHNNRVEDCRISNELDKLIIVEDLDIPDLGAIRAMDTDHYGFIVSQHIFGIKGGLRDWILDNKWTDELNGDKFKSRKINQLFRAVDAQGRNHKLVLPIKQVCVWSQHYADIQRKQFQERIVKDAQVQRQATISHKSSQDDRTWNPKTLEQDEQLLGYQLYATTETYMPSIDVGAAYRRLTAYRNILQDIKPNLVKPPIDFPREQFVHAHVMVCYLSALLLALVQHDLDDHTTVNRLCRELSSFNCVNIKENLYYITYWSKLIDRLDGLFGLDFNHDVLTLAEIRHRIAKIK